jgi:hypothetical protein
VQWLAVQRQEKRLWLETPRQGCTPSRQSHCLSQSSVSRSRRRRCTCRSNRELHCRNLCKTCHCPSKQKERRTKPAHPAPPRAIRTVPDRRPLRGAALGTASYENTRINDSSLAVLGKAETHTRHSECQCKPVSRLAISLSSLFCYVVPGPDNAETLESS